MPWERLGGRKAIELHMAASLGSAATKKGASRTPPSD